ncbi:MAG TPA: LPS assembly lipoprotein LptE [Thermodesulfovibrionales bacterium]|nr:LPS assembly lipoprotein LptE [Thermodesulfovibrionales bacterium]
MEEDERSRQRKKGMGWMPSSVSVLFPLFCALLLSGCGYTIHGRANLPFQSISIGKIINKTLEPKLEDKMQVALVEELLRNGFIFEKTADHTIDGTITAYDLRVLSEKGGVAAQYEVDIKGNFRLTDASGKTRPLRSSGAFIVSFLSTGNLEDVMAQKELAIDRAMRDFAREIVASVIYQ